MFFLSSLPQFITFILLCGLLIIVINIVKIYKIEIKTKWSEDDIYIYPTSFDVTLGLQGCKILDALYSIVPISYNDGTTFLEFNLSGFTDF
ncbi:MAG: hypothetical protein ACI86M_003626, partial [Saprospiraceae bacterium]